MPPRSTPKKRSREALLSPGATILASRTRSSAVYISSPPSGSSTGSRSKTKTNTKAQKEADRKKREKQKKQKEIDEARRCWICNKRVDAGDRVSIISAKYLKRMPPNSRHDIKYAQSHGKCMRWLRRRLKWKRGDEVKLKKCIERRGFAIIRYNRHNLQQVMFRHKMIDTLCTAVRAIEEGIIQPEWINGKVSLARLDRLMLLENVADVSKSIMITIPFFISVAEDWMDIALRALDKIGKVRYSDRTDYTVADFSVMYVPPGMDPQLIHRDGRNPRSWGVLMYMSQTESTYFSVLDYRPVSDEDYLGKTQSERDDGRQFCPYFFRSWRVNMCDMSILPEDKYHFGPGASNTGRWVLFLKIALKVDQVPGQWTILQDILERYGKGHVYSVEYIKSAKRMPSMVPPTGRARFPSVPVSIMSHIGVQQSTLMDERITALSAWYEQLPNKTADKRAFHKAQIGDVTDDQNIGVRLFTELHNLAGDPSLDISALENAIEQDHGMTRAQLSSAAWPWDNGTLNFGDNDPSDSENDWITRPEPEDEGSSSPSLSPPSRTRASKRKASSSAPAAKPSKKSRS